MLKSSPGNSPSSRKLKSHARERSYHTLMVLGVQQRSECPLCIHTGSLCCQGHDWLWAGGKWLYWLGWICVKAPSKHSKERRGISRWLYTIEEVCCISSIKVVHACRQKHKQDRGMAAGRALPLQPVQTRTSGQGRVWMADVCRPCWEVSISICVCVCAHTRVHVCMYECLHAISIWVMRD